MEKINCTIDEVAKQKNIVCIGAGKDLTKSFLSDEYSNYKFEKKVIAIIDNSPQKQNTHIECRGVTIPIVSYEKLQEMNLSQVFFIITSINYTEQLEMQLREVFSDKNFLFCVWESTLNYYHENKEINKIIRDNSCRNKIIPQILHWCWFGGNPLPEKEKRCVETWSKYCPDYKIQLWNEENFDIRANTYVYEAYQRKKYAFVSDYVRLWCIYTYGGIYLDSDVELLKNIDAFLGHSAFSGFESRKIVPTGIMGGEKHSEWFKYLLSYYTDRHFILENGECDLTTNTVTITKMTQEKYNIVLRNGYIDLEDVTLYPQEVFCPMDWRTGNLNITNNTYCIHRFSGSWG